MFKFSKIAKVSQALDKRVDLNYFKIYIICGRAFPLELGGWRWMVEKLEACSYIQIILHAVCLGPSLEEKLLVSCDISTSGQEQIKLNTSEVGHKAIGPGSSKNHPSLTANNGGAVDGRVSGTTTAEAEKTSDQNLSIEESGELMKYSAKSSFNQMLLKC